MEDIIEEENQVMHLLASLHNLLNTLIPALEVNQAQRKHFGVGQAFIVLGSVNNYIL